MTCLLSTNRQNTCVQVPLGYSLIKNSDRENYNRTIKNKNKKKIAEFWVIIFSSMNYCGYRLLSFGSTSLMFVNSVMESSASSLEPHSSTPSIDVSEAVLSTVCLCSDTGRDGWPGNTPGELFSPYERQQMFVSQPHLLISFVTLIQLSTSGRISFQHASTLPGGDNFVLHLTVCYHIKFCLFVRGGGGQVCVYIWRLPSSPTGTVMPSL